LSYNGDKTSSHKVRKRTVILDSGTNKEISNWEDAYMDQSRRQILKFIAAAPLALTFGFAGEALMRFAKPSMKPFGLFDPADLPTCTSQPVFQLSDFPQPWTCIPFLYHMKIMEFNPEKQEIRKIPGFLIRLQGHEIVAYSRICPARGCIMNYIADPPRYHCHCVPASKPCCCAADLANPALICPCDGSAFDLARECVFRGPARRPPRKFQLDMQGGKISVVGLEAGAIV
jgi:Rieske Fe-S protein